MLIPCPECGRKVSDRAQACVDCGFPIASHVAEVAEAEAAEADRTSRREIGEVDCPRCEARGFVTIPPATQEEREQFHWCSDCQHSGRSLLFQSSRGYWAVAIVQGEAFGRGEDIGEAALFLGAEAPKGHRYSTTHRRHDSSE